MIKIKKSNTERANDKEVIEELKQELQVMENNVVQQVRTVTQPPAPLSSVPAPAPASPPSFPSTSWAPQAAAPPSAQATQGPQEALHFKPAPRPQGRVEHLLLADSVTRALVYPKLEAPTGSLIRQVNTYSSQFDERAHKPHRNVNEVLRQELSKRKYHTVILGAPSVDISNQDVSAGIIDDNVAETIASSHSMVEAAEYAIKSGGASKVLLLQHMARYDTPRSDPLGARPQLARLANTHMQKARDNSEYAEHILVGEHSNLECDGSVRTNRYTNDQTHVKNYVVRLGKYDGVHLYSQEGAEALTSSILAIMHRARMVRRPDQWGLPSSSSSSGQWTRQPSARGFRSNHRNQSNGQYRSNQEFNLPVWNRFQNFQ